MTEFDCPNPKCGKKSPTLVAGHGKLGCIYCVDREDPTNYGALHKTRKTVGGRMTEADARHIQARMMKRRKTPDPRWL